MPLSEEIKSQIDRTVQSGRSDINLSNDVFLGDDVQELVDLLNTHETITEVNLSRNTLIQKDVEALRALKHVKVLILIMSDISYDEAFILCENQNLRELVLREQDLGKGSFDEHKKIQRTSPLKITVTRGIKFLRHLDTIIELRPYDENNQQSDTVMQPAREKSSANNSPHGLMMSEKVSSPNDPNINTEIPVKDRDLNSNKLHFNLLRFFFHPKNTPSSAPKLKI